MRKVVYYVAVTLDQYIARPDTSIDGFVMEGQHVDDYVQSLQHFDTVLMGRRTYEWGFQFGIQPGQPVPMYAHMQQYVFSQTLGDSQHPQLHMIREDPAQCVRALKTQAGGAIYLSGGGQLAGSLLDAQLVDELIFKVNPIVYGAGIPVFGSLQHGFGLAMLSTKMYSNGVTFLHYTVKP